MSFFPGSLVSANAPSSSFSPLFRLLDDFEQHSRGSDSRLRSPIKTFTPKFDVKEVADSYELHGELPGIDQKDIEIEFSDEQTITIKGHTERTYTSGTPPAGLVEGGSQGAITEGGESKKTESHKATVEDEDAANAKTTSTDVAHHNGNAESKKEPKAPEAKYWVSERSIGEFSRSFTFPVRVDSDKVSASLKDGILSVVVPKAKKQSARKITIG